MPIQKGVTKRVRNGSAVIAYTVAGPHDKTAPTLCLIASTGRGPMDFLHLTDRLVDRGIRVVLPWPRGTGDSTGDLETVDFHDLAGDAAAALFAEAGSGGAFVAGHAYGCWIARTLAAHHRDTIDGVILLAAAAGSWKPELSDAINVAMQSDKPETERLAALRLAFFAENHDPRPWLEGWYPALATVQRAAKTRTGKDTWWQSGTAPILDVVGLQDPFRPEADREFYVREFGSRVELKTVDGTSHALPEEKPERTANIVATWIKARRRSH